MSALPLHWHHRQLCLSYRSLSVRLTDHCLPYIYLPAHTDHTAHISLWLLHRTLHLSHRYSSLLYISLCLPPKSLCLSDRLPCPFNRSLCTSHSSLVKPHTLDTSQTTLSTLPLRKCAGIHSTSMCCHKKSLFWRFGRSTVMCSSCYAMASVILCLTWKFFSCLVVSYVVI